MAFDARTPIDSQSLPVAVIGAGPVGLSAAAHLIAHGIEPVVFEAGAQVGASVREWGHVRVFSPWEFNIDPAASQLLEAAGAYGTIAAVAGAMTTGARAIGPVAGAVYATVFGYVPLLWTLAALALVAAALAWRAEHAAARHPMTAGVAR